MKPDEAIDNWYELFNAPKKEFLPIFALPQPIDTHLNSRYSIEQINTFGK
jgi:hypothetical protein